MSRGHTQSLHQVVVSFIDKRISPVQRRLRRDLICELAQRVCERETDASIFFEQPPLLQQVAVMLHLRHAYSKYEQLAAKIDDQTESLAGQFNGLTDTKTQHDFLGRLIQGDSNRNWWQRFGDKRALARWFDFEVIRERRNAELHHCYAASEIIVEFLANTLSYLHKHRRSDHASRGFRLCKEVELGAFCIDVASRHPKWRVRQFALIAAQSPVLTLPQQAFEKLRQIVLSSHLHPWVQGAALATSWQHFPNDAASLLRARWEAKPTRNGTDFVARRKLFETLKAGSHPRCPQTESLQQTLVLEWCRRIQEDPDSEPSEYTRAALGDVVESHILSSPELLELLPQGCTTAALIALRLGSLQRCTQRLSRAHQLTHTHLTIVVSSIASALASPSVSLLPFRVACNVILPVIHASGREQIWCLAQLRPRLVALQADSTQRPAVHELASHTLEQLRSSFDQTIRQFDLELKSIVRSVPPGSLKSFPKSRLFNSPASTSSLPSNGLFEHNLGRSLSRLSREDWGVTVSVQGEQLIVRRGDIFRTKVWRVLHEARTFAPNKRQGFRHSLGRAPKGEIRAPSGCLDEVTSTVVPGERVFSHYEGSWGRQLPLLDDALSLPIRGTPHIDIFSSYGRTRLTWTSSYKTAARRVIAQAKLNIHYEQLNALRLQCLQTHEVAQRSEYSERLRREFGIDIGFVPYRLGSRDSESQLPALPVQLKSLFPTDTAPHKSLADSTPATAPLNQLGFLALPSAASMGDWGRLHSHYFLSLSGNSQAALAWFLAACFSVFLLDAYRRRRRIRKAREKIPLCIGGWGTRGKSGTERLKAAVFHGLGFQVFSKTTGCEAMFIHSVPEGPAVEIYSFRPYGKATIWEQRDLLELGQRLDSQVFLWECMALNPNYVKLLQRGWMQDDLATITNTYPDHEDIQGPAGWNVAETICSFIPSDSTLLSSEINFAPLIRDRCRDQGTKYIAIPPDEGDLLSQDFLDLFPYQEHPRNIALVARMAKELNLDPQLAIYNMAQHVVPDIGVLKSYPQTQVWGRHLQFINGCSANERTGYLASWERTGCASIDPDKDPHQLVMTVVNNRDDRISRSEVFARILVEDINVDGHLLIGTNLSGLKTYLRDALAQYLQMQRIFGPTDLKQDDPLQLPKQRITKLFSRLRLPTPTWASFEVRTKQWCTGANLQLGSLKLLRARFEYYIHEGYSPAHALPSLDQIQTSLASDTLFFDALGAALGQPTEDRIESLETYRRCPREQLEQHMTRLFAKLVAYARLRTKLQACGSQVGSPNVYAAATESLRDDAHNLYQALFASQLHMVSNAGAKGDAIALRCAEMMPPGTQVRVMGTQNIKGTGLDFVYRWLAVDTVHSHLAQITHMADKQGDEALIDSRKRALMAIASFRDNGFMDLGAACCHLRRVTALNSDEAERLNRVLGELTTRHAVKVQAADETGKQSRIMSRVLQWLEGWLEFLDGAHRYHRSVRIMGDLADRRISHPQAAVLMRELYARAKGGWLEKALRTSFERDPTKSSS